MDVWDVVRLFVNKATVSTQPKRAGNPGYGQLKAIRILVFARLKGLENDTRLVEYLKKHPNAFKALGLNSVPDRTTVGRWWKCYLNLLEETFAKLADMLRLVLPTKLLIVDSTPLVDLYDMEAKWGHTSKGKFRGFKLHAAVNQKGLPLRAVFTAGNKYDGPIFPDLIWDLEAPYVLADAGYDSKENRHAARVIDAKPVIAANVRNGKAKRISYSKLLRTKRYVVEQFNGYIKANLLKGCYLRPKGLVKKAGMVFAALIGYDVEALRAVVYGEESLKSVSKYWA
jgi:IS5 family transposase